MTMTAKILGQVAPAATTDTAIYTVPASTSASVASIVVCNTSTTTSTTFRLAVKANADTLAAKNYLVYEQTIDPKETVTLTLGISLGTGDSVRAYVTLATVSFSAFGVERT
jgi:guanyl-specific ribonuclease Sa